MPEIRIPFFQKTTATRLMMPALLALIAIAVATGTVMAHPLGNFTINRYSRLEIGTAKIDLFYVIDMAEIPTHRIRTQIDSNGDSTISEAEQEQYLASQTSTLAQNFRLDVAGKTLALTNQSLTMHFAEGQAGLPTTRIEAHFQAALQAGTATTALHYQDQNFAGQLGWQEVVVQAIDGVSLQSSSVPNEDVSNELRNYPSDLLSNPPTVNEANVFFLLGANGQTQPQSQAAKVQAASQPSTIGKPTDGFAELINGEHLTAWGMLLALLAAFGWGAAHALSPGHGKTIVGAYLVGARGTVKHALFLGATTTITHTAGVFALGFVTLFLSNFILPETLYPWLGVISGLMIVTLGLTMSWTRLKGALGFATLQAHQHEDVSTDASPTANNAFMHDHGDGHYHSHLPPTHEGAVSWRNLLALGVSGGLIPCPSALVLMLGAISLQRVGFGLLLIFIFSLGLASVLSGIGILLVRTRTIFDRLPMDGLVSRYLPVASALLITLVGVGITWQAFVSTGLLNIQAMQIAQLFR